jgi:aspartate-semialdehyde dehydrogenase
MRFSREPKRIVIAGASSLLGAELKSLLEESRFAAWDFRLIDEEIAAGTLTEAAGEAVVIQPADEDAFAHARFVFFAGSAAFTEANFDFAKRSGAEIIDLSGAALKQGETPWLGEAVPPHSPEQSSGQRIFLVPSVAAEAIAKLALALSPLGVKRLSSVVFQPVSGVGKPGVEELETQTGQLLSFQSVGKQLFDAQVAFSLLDRYGPESMHCLRDFTNRVRGEVRACLRDRVALPSIQVLHAPVFYGTAFSACADLPLEARCEAVAAACKSAGFLLTSEADAPTNISVAGESFLQLAPPQLDSISPGAWWFWGAADNIRVPASNAVKLAEMIAA